MVRVGKSNRRSNTLWFEFYFIILIIRNYGLNGKDYNKKKELWMIS
jgi:hypothetical protein